MLTQINMSQQCTATQSTIQPTQTCTSHIPPINIRANRKRRSQEIEIQQKSGKKQQILTNCFLGTGQKPPAKQT